MDFVLFEGYIESLELFNKLTFAYTCNEVSEEVDGDMVNFW